MLGCDGMGCVGRREIGKGGRGERVGREEGVMVLIRGGWGVIGAFVRIGRVM